jgi:hypothetical protein
MLINRTYTHREFGEIGTVELSIPDGDWTLDGKALPESSAIALGRFALQLLQDSYAGAKTEAEATGAFNKKYDRLADGSLGTRSGAGDVDESTAVARSMVRAYIKAIWGKDSGKWKDFNGFSDAVQAHKLDKVFAENEAVFAPSVAEKVAARKAERERKAALKGKVKINI